MCFNIYINNGLEYDISHYNHILRYLMSFIFFLNQL